MIVRLVHGDPRPIYVQIMDEIRRAVVVGTVRPHDTLPSLRQLAQELRINPNTVQLAYRELEREGVIYTRRGQGTFVAEQPEPESSRGRVRRDVARRALRDASRHGLTVEELIEGITDEAHPRAPSSSEPSTSPTSVVGDDTGEEHG